MDTSDIKKGAKIMLDGAPFVVVEFQFVKPGKGQAFTRTKMKNLLTGQVLERSFRSGEKFEEADVTDKDMQYIYPEGDDMYVFMDSSSGEQLSVHKDALGDAVDFLIDGIEVQLTLFKGNPVSVTLPPHVTVEITETEPGVKGDTASNVTKPATIATGATIQVPLFIGQGETVKVDTRTRAYLERVKTPK